MEVTTEVRTQIAHSVVKPKEALKPPMHCVVMFNDDFTPMDFVVDVITRVFRKDLQSATKIMLEIHHLGEAVCGFYPKDIAETKAAEVIKIARQHGYPLLCEAQTG